MKIKKSVIQGLLATVVCLFGSMSADPVLGSALLNRKGFVSSPIITTNPSSSIAGTNSISTSSNKPISSGTVKPTDVMNEDQWVFFRQASLPSNQTSNPPIWKAEFAKAQQDAINTETTKVTKSLNKLNPSTITTTYKPIMELLQKTIDEYNQMTLTFKKHQDNFAKTIVSLADSMKKINDLLTTQATDFIDTNKAVTSQITELTKNGGLTVEKIKKFNKIT